jgi:hypothetical protein
MRFTTRLAIAAATLAVAAASAVGALAATTTHHHSRAPRAHQAGAAEKLHFHLTPSSSQLAKCMPKVHIDVDLKLTTDKLGFDVLSIRGRHLPPNTAFTTFLISQTGSPFGAAEYIGDFTSNKHGDAHNEFRLIVQEAFSSTLVNGQRVRVRVDLNHVGAWFADPKGDDFCLGANSPVTPFDGDNEAGVQAFNSGNTVLPAP